MAFLIRPTTIRCHSYEGIGVAIEPNFYHGLPDAQLISVRSAIVHFCDFLLDILIGSLPHDGVPMPFLQPLSVGRNDLIGVSCASEGPDPWLTTHPDMMPGKPVPLPGHIWAAGAGKCWPFLSWLEAGPGLDWLDVGCGTGALSAAILAHSQPRSLISIDLSEGFIATARASLPDERAEFRIRRRAEHRT